jgi:hypothetical protein
MKTWQWTALGAAVLIISGCRSDPAIPLLERQLRLQEDEIYRLRSLVEDLQDDNNACQTRRGGSRGTEPADEGPSPSRRTNSSAPPAEGAPPSIELPSGPPSSQLPDTLKGGNNPMRSGVPEVPPNIQGPSKPAGASIDGPMLDGRSEAAVDSTPGRNSEATAFTPNGDSRRVSTIAVNPAMTGGLKSDDRSGDQGLLVVVEPCDRAGRVVDAPARISVVALDPGILDSRGKAARVGRWDFTAAETAGMFRRTASGDAVHLAMAWPSEPPKHGKLHLFVRYITADGRTLETDGPIRVALSGRNATGWTAVPDSIRQQRSAETQPTSDSWQPSATPATRSDDSPLLMATRVDSQRPQRPAWSPERR